MTDLSMYQSVREHIKTGDVIEFAASSALGWAIRKFTGKDVNHTSIAINYVVEEGSAVRKYILEALNDGFRPNFLSMRLKRFEGKVYWLPLNKDYDGLRVRIGQMAHKYIGVPYDFPSLFKQVTGAVSSNAKLLFCSEAVDQILRDTGLLTEDFNDGQRLRPGEFDLTGLYNPRVRIL